MMSRRKNLTYGWIKLRFGPRLNLHCFNLYFLSMSLESAFVIDCWCCVWVVMQLEDEFVQYLEIMEIQIKKKVRGDAPILKSLYYA